MRKCFSVPVAVLVLVLAGPYAPLADESLEDDNGRIVREIRDNGQVIDYRYDEEGRVIAEIDDQGNVTRYWYDRDGNRHVVDE